MSVALRKADRPDSGLLFGWVNEPDSLAGKLLTTGPIERERHEAWFAAQLADPETFIWIIESDQKPVGQLRLMNKAEAYEVDIYVARNWRHRGVAQQALTVGIRNFLAEREGSQRVRARVRSDNAPSQRLFERAGFVLAAHNGDHLVYDLTAS
jgi:RimJ/RimL family protein N-acetyltransferase